MATTTSYLQSVKAALDEAARQKKEALNNAYNAATTADFSDKGIIKQSNKPGSLDSAYMAKQANISDDNEASGTLRSGQRLSQEANAQSAYRSDVIAALNARNTGQNTIDTENAYAKAKLDAEYGPIADLTKQVPVDTPSPTKPSAPSAPSAPSEPKTTTAPSAPSAPAAPAYVRTSNPGSPEIAELAKFYAGLNKQNQKKTLATPTQNKKTPATSKNIGRNAKDRK